MANLSPSQPIRYKPLSHPSSIRLIVLEPGLQPQRISCHFLESSLNSQLYEALSYEWGDDVPADMIFVDNFEVKICRNLYNALQCLRWKDKQRKIWTDALCIDQNDPKEKGRLVQMMGRIYKEAERVVVWLGVGMDGSDRAIDTIARFYDFEHCGTWAKETATTDEQVLQFIDSLFPARNDLSGRITELVSLAERSYWERVWIVQEFHLAQDATVYCGQKSITLKILTKFCAMLDGLGVAFVGEGDDTSQVAQEEIAICQMGIGEMNHSKMAWHCALRTNRTTNHDTRTLNNLLWELVRSDFRSTNPRDYFYALNAIASDVNDGDIQCDYEKDIKEVYRDLLNLLLAKMTTSTLPLAPSDLEFTLREKMGVGLDGGHEELIEQYRIQQGIQDTKQSLTLTHSEACESLPQEAHSN
jgi:hypothetical protein